MEGILLFAETDEGQINPSFWELVTVGRELSPQLGNKLRAVVQGWQVKGTEEARRSGADQVYLAEDPRLAEPWPDAHLASLTAVCHELQPAMIVMPRTPLGMEIAVRLSYRLGAGLVQDAMTLQVTDDGLTATRPVFGGAVLATIRLTKKPWIVVPYRRAFSPAEPTSDRQAELVSVQPELPAEALKTVCSPQVRQQSSGPNLERAQVIIAGGFGLGGPEPFQLLQEIADLMGGAVGASRPPCDVGWVPTSMQIGLTGKTIAPDLYIAVAISGAIQHMTGCSSAKTIVAINSDPKAPIFHMATYGVVGDWQEVLPALRDAIAGHVRDRK